MTHTTLAPGSQHLEGLLIRMAKKDEAAFEQLYVASKRKLFSAALAIVKRRHLAEEIVQEAYVRIWLNAANYRRPLGSPMVWMLVIARNLAIDLARKPAREIASDDAFLCSFPTECPTPLEAIEMSEDQAEALMHHLKVQYALQALDPGRRHLIIAAYIRGESRKQLSERYGVPVNTIKTWIRRALLEARSNLQNGEGLACDRPNTHPNPPLPPQTSKTSGQTSRGKFPLPTGSPRQERLSPPDLVEPSRPPVRDMGFEPIHGSMKNQDTAPARGCAAKSP